MGLADWVSMPVRDAGGWEQGATFCGCVVGRQTLVVCRWTSAIALGARFTLALKWKAFIHRPLLASGRMPCRACAASGGIGVLQLRRCFNRWRGGHGLGQHAAQVVREKFPIENSADDIISVVKEFV